MSNPNDVIRDAILRELHDVFQAARSVKATAVGIKDLQKRLRDKHGYKQQQVAANLTYLIQKGWAEEVVEQRTYTTDRGTQMPSPKTSYRISDIGIDLLEKASVFGREDEKTRSINITNIQGVTVVGDQNVVNTELTDASRALSELRSALLDSTDLDERAKLDAAADIEAILAQLQKPEPSKPVVQALWSNIERAAAAGQLVAFATQAGTALASLLG
jgi:hypothetical protein